MKYDQWKKLVREKGWSMTALRCDTPPSAELLDLMAEVGLGRWEKYVTRLEREQS